MDARHPYCGHVHVRSAEVCVCVWRGELLRELEHNNLDRCVNEIVSVWCISNKFGHRLLLSLSAQPDDV